MTILAEVPGVVREISKIEKNLAYVNPGVPMVSNKKFCQFGPADWDIGKVIILMFILIIFNFIFRFFTLISNHPVRI